MILSAVSDKYGQINFQKPKSMVVPVEGVQFVVFEKFTRAYLLQIARENLLTYSL